MILETERLTVRHYRQEDAWALHQVMRDARVHIYTKDKDHPWDEARTKAYIRFMMEKNFRTPDCYHGAVIEKKSGLLIGLCGLNPYQENEPEIEWKLGVPYWNQGYATELGRQMIREAFAFGKVKGIYGMAQRENIASRKVLEKIGMAYVGNQVFHHQEDAFYYIANPNRI